MKLRHVSSVGSQDDVYTLTHTGASGSTPEKFTFTVTSASLSNVVGKTGLTFVIDTTLATNNIVTDSLSGSDAEKYIKIGSNTAPLISTFKGPGSTPIARNPIMTTGAEYLVVYDGSSFVVMNEAMMIDATTYNTYSNENISHMAAPTVEFMMNYVGEQISTRYTYLVCPPDASGIPSGAEYKANASATAITGTMGAAAERMYIIYLVLHNVHTGGSDVYDEWICVNTGTASTPSYSWEKIGNTDVNLNHTHNILSSGAHGHTMQKNGSHAHDVTVPSHSHSITSSGAHSHSISSLTLTPKFSTSTNGTDWTVTDRENKNEVKINLSSNSGNTGSAGGHSHTLQNTGAHVHTMDSKGEHSHTLQNTGAHVHTMDTQGAHSHSITVTPTLTLSTSGNADSDDTIVITLQQPPAKTGGVSTTHTHTLQNTGAHVHTMDTQGAHSHTFTYAAIVDGETLKLAVSSHTESAGAHSHTLENAGSHTHTMGTSGAHTHTITNTDWTRYIKIATSGSSDTAGGHSHTLQNTGAHVHTMDKQGAHSHTLQNTGAHVHTMDTQGAHSHTTPAISSSEYLKLEVTGSGSIASSGSHTHTTGYESSHTLTTSSNGSHSHTVDNGGAHSHTTGQPVSV